MLDKPKPQPCRSTLPGLETSKRKFFLRAFFSWSCKIKVLTSKRKMLLRHLYKKLVHSFLLCVKSFGYNFASFKSLAWKTVENEESSAQFHQIFEAWNTASGWKLLFVLRTSLKTSRHNLWLATLSPTSAVQCSLTSGSNKRLQELFNFCFALSWIELKKALTSKIFKFWKRKTFSAVKYAFKITVWLLVPFFQVPLMFSL